MQRQIDIAHGTELQRGVIALSSRSEFDLAARVVSPSRYRRNDDAKSASVDLAPGRGACPSAPCWPTARATSPRAVSSPVARLAGRPAKPDGWCWSTAPARKDAGGGTCKSSDVNSLQPAALPRSGAAVVTGPRLRHWCAPTHRQHVMVIGPSLASQASSIASRASLNCVSTSRTMALATGKLESGTMTAM